MSLPTVRLLARRDGATLAEGSFQADQITAGSDPSAQFALPGAAPFVAVFQVGADGSVSVQDPGTDALRLGGEAIAFAALTSGATLESGDVTIEVTWEAAGASLPATASVVAYDDEDAEGPAADPLALVRDASRTTMNADTASGKLLEVSHIWGEALIAKQHFRAGVPVTVGSSFGHRWRLFGREMGWVPEAYASVLRVSPPVWSEVDEIWSNDFFLPADFLPGNTESYLLFTPKGNHWTARVSSWSGSALIDGIERSFDQLVSSGQATRTGDGLEIHLDEKTDLTIRVGEQVFFARLTDPAKAPITQKERDQLMMTMGGLSAALFAGWALIVGFVGAGNGSEGNELNEEIFEALIQQEQQKIEEKKEEPKDEKKPNEANPDAGEGAKAKDKEGKVGEKSAKLDEAAGQKTRSATDGPAELENSGLLGAMNDTQNMLSSGLNASMAAGIGGLIGTKGTQLGVGGLGMRGGGLGGGGTGDGLGGLGSSGSGLGGSGSGRGGGYATGGGGTGGTGVKEVAVKKTRPPSAVPQDPIVMGSLDKSLIDKVVRSKQSLIKYCYERELTKNPTLAGKITVKFTIGKDGSVSTASGSGLNATADKCIIDKFYQMKFPEPQGGGIVIVNYPFTFSPGE